MLPSLSQDKVSELFRWWYFKIIRATSQKHYFIITTYSFPPRQSHEEHQLLQPIHGFTSSCPVDSLLLLSCFQSPLPRNKLSFFKHDHQCCHPCAWLYWNTLFLSSMPMHRGWSLSLSSSLFTIFPVLSSANSVTNDLAFSSSCCQYNIK